MCDLHLNSLKQVPTPLNTLFFSEFNRNLLQRAIRQNFKNETGISIDYQNNNDLFAIMRVVFINNSKHPSEKVNEQVKMMNSMVIKTAMSQISSGVSQYIDYIRQIDTQPVPLDLPDWGVGFAAQTDMFRHFPASTTTYGNKIPINDKIGV